MVKHGFWVLGMLASWGCSTRPTLAPTSPERPTGVWALEAFELSGGGVVSVQDAALYTFELVDATRVSIRADCNVCGGGYTLTDDTLEIGLLACTLVACPPGSLEASYLQALDSAFRLEVVSEHLKLLYDGGALRFRRSSPP